MLRCSTYEIHFGNWSALNHLLDHQNYSAITVLVDDNTEKNCLPIFKDSVRIDDFHIICIPPGELHKNINLCNKIWEEMSALGMDRHSLLINLGGGVIGDMGGFCASCYMRGIDFVQIPTSLLSMTDSSVGGKLGVDFKDLKNLIGLFGDPKMVLIEDRFLSTLPFGELKSGFAESLKHALINDDDFWEKLIKLDLSDYKAWNSLIKHSVSIKLGVVKEDPHEIGLRKILNFGHTIGHAVESLKLQEGNPLKHGEAVALGMIIESFLAEAKGQLKKEDCLRIEAGIDQFFERVEIRPEHFDTIVNRMKSDKKNHSGTIRAALVNRIGQCEYDIEIHPTEIKSALQRYSS